jgi:hypothetical protein
MKYLRLFGFWVVIGGAVSLLPQAGGVVEANRVGFCDETCTPSSPCNQACLDPDGEQGLMSCGQYGVCNPPCNPNWQAVSQTPIGAWAVDYWSQNYCEHWVAYQVTWHDVNNCGSPDYTSCYHSLNATDSPAGWCCAYYACGGSSCG